MNAVIVVGTLTALSMVVGIVYQLRCIHVGRVEHSVRLKRMRSLGHAARLYPRFAAKKHGKHSRAA